MLSGIAITIYKCIKSTYSSLHNITCQLYVNKNADQHIKYIDFEFFRLNREKDVRERGLKSCLLSTSFIPVVVFQQKLLLQAITINSKATHNFVIYKLQTAFEELSEKLSICLQVYTLSVHHSQDTSSDSAVIQKSKIESFLP